MRAAGPPEENRPTASSSTFSSSSRALSLGPISRTIIAIILFAQGPTTGTSRVGFQGFSRSSALPPPFLG